MNAQDVPVSQFRARLAGLLDHTIRTGDPIHLTRDGRRVATLISTESFETLLDHAENWLDFVDAQEVLEDPDTTWIPWEQVIADLGYTRESA
jgi:prevent-host-death family protein